MSHIKNFVKFDRLNTQFWKKSKLDAKGRVLIPKKLRQKLGLSSNSFILWISTKHKHGKINEFILEIAVGAKK